MSCEHDCEKPALFPRTIDNRPALDNICYRVGDYHSFRDYLLDRLDKRRALSQWTHRGADDPGIALLECTAITGEILAFYQNLYANEAFLRSADWRDSVAALVQLTGYRLAPGVGGEALFAFAVSGEQAVTVPVGFGIKAQLEGDSSPAIFESINEITAWSALNRFNLYSPRLAPQNISSGMSVLELQAVDSATALAEREAHSIKAGDRLILVPDTSMFDGGGGSVTTTDAQDNSEIIIVSEVEQVLDRIIIRFEGALTVDRSTSIRAYKIDRSFRHFGFNAPRMITRLNETTGQATRDGTEFSRLIWGNHTFPSADQEFYSNILREEMPLDSEIDDLATGGQIIIQGEMYVPSIGNGINFTVVREIAEARADSLVWGGLASGATVVVMTERTIANTSVYDEEADIRRLYIHEVIGPELTLQAVSEWPTGTFSDSVVNYYGRYSDAITLSERELLFEDTDGERQEVRVINTREEFDLSGRDEDNYWMWPITLDQQPKFIHESFSESESQVNVYGNLVQTNQGETQKQAVIGSGDARQIFQTFALPKSPLTYLLDDAQTPPQAPELDVYVDGLLYERVDNYFNSGPQDRHYVIRDDDDENSYIQFGDGKTGLRLPSGKNNVVALYRTGIGAYGPLEAEAKPIATGTLKPLENIYMPEPAVGGAVREHHEGARIAAPQRMQSLGRLVGLSDYEAEALALPGVLKVRADWSAPTGTPLVRLAVITEGGDPAEVDKVRSSMQTANRCRGMARFPIKVVTGIRQYLYLNITLGYAADRRANDIESAVIAALGISGINDSSSEGAFATDDGGSGLFGLPQRLFGQGVHVSQVIGVCQQVVGVTWVRVDGLQNIDLGIPPENDPNQLIKPAYWVRNESVSCPGDHLLVLHVNHIDLSLSQEISAEGCE